MTDLTQPDRELARLAREIDRTRAEYQQAMGEERAHCWKLYQRAMTNYNNAVAKANAATSENLIQRAGT